MGTRIAITESLVGMDVIDAKGRPVGVVTSVHGDTAFVDPLPEVTGQVASTLGWDEERNGEHPLPTESIERIRNDEIHLYGKS